MSFWSYIANAYIIYMFGEDVQCLLNDWQDVQSNKHSELS